MNKSGDREAAKVLMRKMKICKKKNHLYAAMQYLAFLQIPLHAVTFSLIMYIKQNPHHYLFEPLSVGGFFWFPNLMAPDPFLVLPIISAFMQNRSIVNTLAKNKEMMQGQQQAEVMGTLHKVMPIIPIVFLPLQMKLPVAMTIYLITLSGYQLCCQALVKTDFIEKAFKIGPKHG